MHHLKIFILIAFIFLFLHSCDPCKNLDCLPTTYEAHLRILNKGNGTDLIFGANSIYDKNKIKFYSIKGIDTIFFHYQPFRLVMNDYDSILLVNFFPKSDTAYIKLSNGDIDTLTFKFGQEQTRCCTIETISSLRYNNSAEINNRNGTVELKK